VQKRIHYSLNKVSNVISLLLRSYLPSFKVDEVLPTRMAAQIYLKSNRNQSFLKLSEATLQNEFISEKDALTLNSKLKK